jgi:hypothetical protein
VHLISADVLRADLFGPENVPNETRLNEPASGISALIASGSSARGTETVLVKRGRPVTGAGNVSRQTPKSSEVDRVLACDNFPVTRPGDAPLAHKLFSYRSVDLLVYKAMLRYIDKE